MIQKMICAMFAMVCFIASDIAHAQGYIPDLMEFDGETTLEFPADETLDLSGGATIEFWVQPDWKDAPNFDPVVLSYAGDEGASYLVTILRDRDGVGFMSGEEYQVAPFDFTDGKMHHVALIDYGDRTQVLIDKDLVAELPMTIRALPADALFVGSSDGESDPFWGALGGLRLWGVAVAPEVVLEHAFRSVLDENLLDHPDLRFLIAHSAFETGDLMMATASAAIEQ